MPAAWVAAIGGIAGAASSADASRSGAGAQGAASKESIAAQQGRFDQVRRDTAPWRDTGSAAVGDLGTYLGIAKSGPSLYANDQRYKSIYDQVYSEADQAHRKSQGGRPLSAAQSIDPSAYDSTMKRIDQIAQQQFEAKYPDVASQTNTNDPRFGSLLKKFSSADLAADPVYNSGLKFGLDQGTSAINARSLATGNYDSGATLKALTRYGNDYGSTKAEGAYNRYNQDQTNIFNKLSGVAGTGQTATQQVTTAGTNATNQISADLTGAGNARAAGIVGNANAWGGAASNVANAYNTYDQNQRYKALTNNSGNYTSSGTYSPYYSGNSSDGSYAYG